MALATILQERVKEHRKANAFRRTTQDLFLFDVFAWANALAKEGISEGWFNITEFCKHRPEYIFDGTTARLLLEREGFHVIGRIQKECRQHPKRMLINWMPQSEYEYFYCETRD